MRYEVFQGSTFLSTTAGGSPDTIKATLENPARSHVVGLVLRAIHSAIALGNANYMSFHLRWLRGVANGVGLVPGVSTVGRGSGELPKRSALAIRQDNAADGGAVTAITATALGPFMSGGTGPGGSTAAGMTASSEVDLAPTHGVLAVLPGDALGMCGSQTGVYATRGFEWLEVDEQDYLAQSPEEWAAFLARLRRGL